MPTGFESPQSTVGMAHSDTFFPGADYNNVRMHDFDLGRNFDNCLVNKKQDPRMPWRDIHVRLEGEIIRDMSRSFIQYWSFIKTEFTKDKEAGAIGVSQDAHKRERTIRGVQSQGGQKEKPKYLSQFQNRVEPQKKKSESSFVEDDSDEKKDQLGSFPKRYSRDDLVETRNDRRVFQSMQNTAKAELETLIKQMKESNLIEEEQIEAK